jgi:1-acyl-sn-glycerol-3-phosphate acyltransferase
MAKANPSNRPARRVTGARRRPAAAAAADPLEAVRKTPAPNGHRAASPKRGAPSKRRRQALPVRPTEIEPLDWAEPAADKLEDAALEPGLRQELMDSLEAMIGRLRRLSPGYNPPPFSPRQLLELIEHNVDKIPPELGLGILGKLRQTIGEDLFDADTWKGMWTMLNYTFDYQADVLKRRMTGDYQTDEWGLDREYLEAVLPFFDLMYQKYWRVALSGLENIPDEGRALLVVNHSGQLPWDGSMLATGVMRNHPRQRLVRTLYAAWFPTLPFVSDLLTKCGQVLATDENGIRLLEQDELVAVFPEGYKGVGKLYKDRYRLARFGRGGFVRMALKTGAPILPVSVVGAEETYISLAKSDLMARLTGFPYFPISPTWPWLGPLGFVPLPTKWYIDIGAPIPMDGYGPGAVNNLMVVSQLTDQVRNVVQEMLYARLKQRRSVFAG